MLSEENIRAYQKLCKEHFGKDISREHAIEQGTKLIQYVEIVYNYSEREDREALESGLQGVE